MGGTGLEQHGHAAGVANNSPVGCCLVRGFQRLGMSTKKAPPAGAPFAPPRLGGTGQEQCKSEPFVKKQRQGIIVAMVSCLFRIWDGLSAGGMVYSAQQIGIYEIGGIDIIMWNELGISGGTAIVILIALYFVIKWAVKNGIKEAYSAITGKKTDEDIKNEKELKELGLDSENQ